MGEQQDGEMKAGSKDIRSKRSKGTSLHLDIMWEWTTIADVLGANSRHLSELYALKQSNHYQSLMGNKAGTFEDIVDAYLAYLQVAVVNPATEKALLRLQWYASDVRKGSIPDEKLRFGASWRYPRLVRILLSAPSGL